MQIDVLVFLSCSSRCSTTMGPSPSYLNLDALTGRLLATFLFYKRVSLFLDCIVYLMIVPGMISWNFIPRIVLQ